MFIVAFPNHVFRKPHSLGRLCRASGSGRDQGLEGADKVLGTGNLLHPVLGSFDLIWGDAAGGA